MRRLTRKLRRSPGFQSLEARRLLTVDLLVELDAAEPASAGEEVTRVVRVFNNGSDDALDAMVTSELTNELVDPVWTAEAGFAQIVDQQLNRFDADLVFEGWTAAQQLGRGVQPIGDINGDGVQDLAVSKDRILFGSETLSAEIGRFPFGGETGLSVHSSALFNETEPLGDINGDGFDDLAFDGRVVLGAADIGVVGSLDLDELDEGRGFHLQGFGRVYAAGDVNGDGLADIAALGPPANAVLSTDVYLIWGSAEIADHDPLRWPDLTDRDNGVGIRIASRVDSVAAIGDVNADGLDDVYFEMSARTVNDRTGMAGVVMFGAEDVTGLPENLESIDAASGFSVGTLTRAVINTHQTTPGLGADDVNGDGIDDFLITYVGSRECFCTATDKESALTYAGVAVIFGSANIGEGGHFDAETEPLVAIDYLRPFLNVPGSATVADRNADGLSDVALGGHVFLGGSEMMDVSFDLGDWEDANGENGFATRGVWGVEIDINNDGIMDRVVSDSAARVDSMEQAGMVFIKFGSAMENPLRTGSGDIREEIDIASGEGLIYRVTGTRKPDEVAEEIVSTVTLPPAINLTQGQSFPSAWNSGDVDLADFDDDGDLDIYFTLTDGPDQVFIQEPSTSFARDFTTNTVDAAGIYSDVGDVGNDGNLDVVTVSLSGTGAYLLKNSGRTPLNAWHQRVSPINPDVYSIDVALADLNGDDFVDMFVANTRETPNWVFFGSRSGFYDSNQSLGRGSSKSIEFADMDGDGDLDAVVANVEGNNSEARNVVWLNDGNGFFDRHAEFGPGGEHIAAGDVDSDGDIDLVGAQSGPNIIWLNDGDANFVAVGELGDEVTSHIALGDLDNDGDLDIVAANWGGDGNTVWKNDGNGSFRDTQVRLLPGSRSEHVALGDLDGDDDLDVVFATGGAANVIFTNNLAMTDLDRSPNVVAEHAAVGTSVGIRAFTELQSTVEYFLSDDAGGLFAIDGQTGVVTVAGEIDFDDAESYRIEISAVRATDGSPTEALRQSFRIQIQDVPEPTATVRAIDIDFESPFRQQINVRYDGFLDQSTIGDDDIEVVLPDGTVAIPTYGGSESFSLPQSFTAIYYLDPPGGAWESSDNGVYDVRVREDEIRNRDGTPADAGSVYLFEVIIPESSSEGDFNGDGVVGFDDFLVMSSNFGKRTVTKSEGDLDGNGEVDFTDFLILSSHYDG